MENGSFDLEDFPSRFSSDVEELLSMERWSMLGQAKTKDILSVRDGSYTTTEDGLIILEDLEEEESTYSGWAREEKSSKVNEHLIFYFQTVIPVFETHKLG